MTSLRGKITKQYLLAKSRKDSHITLRNMAVKRKEYEDAARFFPLPRWAHIEPCTHPNFKAEWLTVQNARPEKVMLYMHGGGFAYNSTKLHRRLIANITHAGRIKALSLDYSLAPENPFPIAQNETLAAYKWLLTRYDAHNIVVAGDSAGGSLALSLLLQIKELALPMPAAAIALCPATDAATPTPNIEAANDTFRFDMLAFFVTSYFDDTPRDHPIASPIFSDLSGLPPLFIQADKQEILYYNCARFVEKARRQGTHVDFYETDGLWHDWLLFDRYVPEARAAFNQIGRFIMEKTD